MKQISLSELANLLKEKFEGEIRFEGHVNFYDASKGEAHNSGGNYEATGQFTLRDSPHEGGNLELILRGDRGNESTFRFRRRKSGEKEVLKELPFRRGNYYLEIPVDFGEDFRLAIINPRDIFY